MIKKLTKEEFVKLMINEQYKRKYNKRQKSLNSESAAYVNASITKHMRHKHK